MLIYLQCVWKSFFDRMTWKLNFFSPLSLCENVRVSPLMYPSIYSLSTFSHTHKSTILCLWHKALEDRTEQGWKSTCFARRARRCGTRTGTAPEEVRYAHRYGTCSSTVRTQVRYAHTCGTRKVPHLVQKFRVPYQKFFIRFLNVSLKNKTFWKKFSKKKFFFSASGAVPAQVPCVQKYRTWYFFARRTANPVMNKWKS